MWSPTKIHVILCFRWAQIHLVPAETKRPLIVQQLHSLRSCVIVNLAVMLNNS